MLFGLLAHDEGVDIAAIGMHDGGRYRIRAKGEASHGREIPIGGELAEQGSDEAGGFVV